ncbi:hypothetical protein D5278_21180 [bacterium 1XD21-13]|nr:hypothetical protein [bacterium 1XD21-13]
MHLEKRLFYLRNNDTQVGFHTGNGTTQEVIDLDKANKNDIIVNCNIRKVRNKDKNETHMRVNPNKNNNGYILTEYTAFQKVMQDVFEELGVKEFKWKRVDMSFNTMDNKYYANYTKLNRLLIACIANSTNDKNTYDTKNFWNGKTKSLATKNQLREVEFYDKADESQNRSPYYSRLELRSVRMNGDIEHEFLEVWFERLDKAIEEFEAVQNRFNQNMAEIYLEDLAKKKHDREFLSINSFLMTRRDYIFTSSQMKKLLMLLGLSTEEAQNKAYNFKKYHSIEYFKREDIEEIVADIKEKIIEYFSK